MNDNDAPTRVALDDINLENHPCFNRSACATSGRIHLPVAPQCNIQCNYCNRKFDCVNESRPGVTSTVLTPGQALAYLDGVMDLRDDIAVVGIAGPGDPFANPKETMETFRLIRAKYPEMILCLSTNGLGLTREYVNELAELKVSHVTLTINAIDPEIAGKIYAWARHEKRIYRNEQAGRLMIDKQLQALTWIKEAGMIAKVNSIIVPGFNDEHLKVVSETVKGYGADIMNCIPLLPTEDTAFADLEEPDSAMRFRVRTQCGENVNQMTHCARCRADAIGRLNEPMSDEVRALIQKSAMLPMNPQDERPYVAVATREGMLVNKHMGEAMEFTIFGIDPDDEEEFIEIGVRKAPPPGGRDERWQELADTLSDCRAILANAAGSTPERVLSECGIRIVQMEGLIEAGLMHLYHGEPLPPSVQREFRGCGTSCGGDGTGCG